MLPVLIFQSLYLIPNSAKSAGICRRTSGSAPAVRVLSDPIFPDKLIKLVRVSNFIRDKVPDMVSGLMKTKIACWRYGCLS